MKYYFTIIILIALSFYVILLYRNDTKLSTPYYRTSEMYENNQYPTYAFSNKSFNAISFDRIEKIKKDYLFIWSALDLIHNTNDINESKKYCTEEFYKQLSTNYFPVPNIRFHRTSLTHHLSIMAISPDGLICSIIDSNLLIKYLTPTFYYFDTINVAVILFYQGENWRIDALQVF